MEPAFSWIPSVGVSALAVNDPQAFPLWQDDLLAVSLGDCWPTKGCSIHRIRRQGTEVKYVEKIRTKTRIRDIAYMSHGRIALLTNSRPSVWILSKSFEGCDDALPEHQSIYAIHCPIHRNMEVENPPTRRDEQVNAIDIDAVPGSQLFSSHCSRCHRLNPGEHDIGPGLAGVLGRTAGKVDGYFNFSPALRRAGIVWTRDNLAEFIVDPQETIPGTVMPAPNVNEAEAESIVDFLGRVQDSAG